MSQKILVIEDDPEYQELLAFTFSKYALTICTNAEEAVERMRTAAYDLIISDINLLGVSGMAFLRGLKARGVTEKVPVIMCSSMTHVRVRQEAMDMGASGFITKPFKPEGLRTLVDAILVSGSNK